MSTREGILAAFRALHREGRCEAEPEECLRLAFELYAAEQEEADLCARRVSNNVMMDVSGFNAASETPYHALRRYMERVVSRDESFSWRVVVKRMWDNHRYFERERAGEVSFDDQVSGGKPSVLNIGYGGGSEEGSHVLWFADRPHLATWAQLTKPGGLGAPSSCSQRENMPIGSLLMRIALLQR